MKFLINPIKSIGRKFLGYLKKDILLLVKRKKYLYLSIMIPLLIGLIFLFFLNPSVSNIKAGICDYDSTSYSKQAIADLRGFSPVFFQGANCTQELIKQIKSGKLSLGLEIPRGFSQNILELKQAKMLVYYDSTDIAFANLIDWKVDLSMAPYERTIINLLNNQLKARVSAIRSGVDFMKDVSKDYRVASSRLEEINEELIAIEDLDTEFILNPIWTEKISVYQNEQSKDAGIAFIFPIITLFIVLMLASTSFIYDKKTHFLVRVKASTSPLIYIFAKLAFFFIITLANFLIILLLFLAYGASYPLPIFKILNLIFFISIINTLLGMLIGLISDNEGIAILFSLIISFPFMLLSGIFYPLQTMPRLIQYFAKLIPLNYQIDYSKAVLLFGQSIGTRWLITAFVLLIAVYYLITRKY